MRRFSDFRNRSQKQHPVTPEVALIPVATFVPIPETDPIAKELPSDEGWHMLSYVAPVPAIPFVMVDGIEVRASAGKYLEFLSAIVAECEDRFGADPHAAV